METLLKHPQARQEIDRRLEEAQNLKSVQRQLGTGVVSGVTTLLGGTLDELVNNILGLIPTNKAVEGLQKFPESALPALGIMIVSPADQDYRDLSLPGSWSYRSAWSMSRPEHSCQPWL